MMCLLSRTEKRERQREAKAEVAAQLEKSIEKELLERLQKGVYPTDIVNINMKEYEKVSSILITPEGDSSVITSICRASDGRRASTESSTIISHVCFYTFFAYLSYTTFWLGPVVIVNIIRQPLLCTHLTHQSPCWNYSRQLLFFCIGDNKEVDFVLTAHILLVPCAPHVSHSLPALALTGNSG